MKKILYFVSAGLLLAILLAACQAAKGATPGSVGSPQGGFGPNSPGFQTQIASNPDLATRVASGGGRPGGFNPNNPTFQTQVAGNPDLQTQIASGGGPGNLGGPPQLQTPAPTAEPAATATPQPTAAPVSQTAGAEKAAQDYFAALERGDFAAAAGLTSAFSRMVPKLTAGDIVTALTEQKQAGAAWSGLQVQTSQLLDGGTVLVHVTYQLAVKDAKTGEVSQVTQEEQWPFRLEARKWLYNWNNLIDFKTLSFTTQQTAGLAVTPLQLTRYSDRLVLTVLAQNGTNEAIAIGQTNQTLATFHFGDQSVDAENTRYVFDRLRSYEDVEITLKGLYTTYPDSVELVKYTQVKVAPWFTFSLVD